MLVWGLLIHIGFLLNYLKLIKNHMSMLYSFLYFQLSILYNHWVGVFISRLQCLSLDNHYQVFTILKHDFNFLRLCLSCTWVQKFLPSILTLVGIRIKIYKLIIFIFLYVFMLISLFSLYLSIAELYKKILLNFDYYEIKSIL